MLGIMYDNDELIWLIGMFQTVTFLKQRKASLDYKKEKLLIPELKKNRSNYMACGKQWNKGDRALKFFDKKYQGQVK